MFEFALTVLVWITIAVLLLIGLSILFLPLYFWLRWRDDAQAEERAQFLREAAALLRDTDTRAADAPRELA